MRETIERRALNPRILKRMLARRLAIFLCFCFLYTK